jgi:hypothetical protein
LVTSSVNPVLNLSMAPGIKDGSELATAAESDAMPWLVEYVEYWGAKAD